MNKLWCLIILFVGCGVCEGQNLVNNWSFEDTVSCPTATAQIDKAIGWSSYRESADYFNACAPSTIGGVSVPQNAWGYQYAKSGNAYAGFTAFGSSSTNFREYLGCQLNQPTQTGQKYFVSFYVCRAHNIYGMQWACNNIGMRFSTIPFIGFPSNASPAPINNIAHINDTTIIVDTTNWVKISGAFLADSIYSYVMFGNLFDDSLTSSMQIGPNLGYAYYYIDDIRISTDSAFVNGINEQKNNIRVEINPNPFTDKLSIATKAREQLEITLYDITSRKAFNQSFTNSTSINTVQLSKGIYIYELRNKNGLIKKGKVVKE